MTGGTATRATTTARNDRPTAAPKDTNHHDSQSEQSGKEADAGSDRGNAVKERMPGIGDDDESRQGKHGETEKASQDAPGKITTIALLHPLGVCALASSLGTLRLQIGAGLLLSLAAGSSGIRGGVG